MRQGGLCAAVLLLLATAPVVAAELGTLKLWSGLGQPLNAEIDLRNASPGERVTARVAPASRYRGFDLAYTDTAGAARVAVRRRPDGQPYIAISTPARTNEPVVELLVELESGGRTAIANYTLFLDPPLYRVPAAAAIAAPATPTAPPFVDATAAPAPPPIVETPAAPAQPPFVTAPAAPAPPPVVEPPVPPQPKPDTVAIVKPPAA